MIGNNFGSAINYSWNVQGLDSEWGNACSDFLSTSMHIKDTVLIRVGSFLKQFLSI